MNKNTRKRVKDLISKTKIKSFGLTQNHSIDNLERITHEKEEIFIYQGNLIEKYGTKSGTNIFTYPFIIRANNLKEFKQKLINKFNINKKYELYHYQMEILKHIYNAGKLTHSKLKRVLNTSSDQYYELDKLIKKGLIWREQNKPNAYHLEKDAIKFVKEKLKIKYVYGSKYKEY